MADDHELCPGLADHRRRHLAGERAFALPVDVLRGNGDVRIAKRFGRRVHRREGRRDNDFDVVDLLDDAAQLLDERDRLLNGLEHLPVARNQGCSHKPIPVSQGKQRAKENLCIAIIAATPVGFIKPSYSRLERPSVTLSFIVVDPIPEKAPKLKPKCVISLLYNPKLYVKLINTFSYRTLRCHI